MPNRLPGTVGGLEMGFTHPERGPDLVGAGLVHPVIFQADADTVPGSGGRSVGFAWRVLALDVEP